MSAFEGSYLGDNSRINADTKLECGVCWYVYDPAQGDPVWQIATGTAFADLPEAWRCPRCDAAPDKFMVLDGPRTCDGRDRPISGSARLEQRVSDIAEAYRAVDSRMRALPVHNPSLAVETVGFRRVEDEIIGVLVTPWCMNLMIVPLDPDAPTRTEGSKRMRSLPSGTYEFTAGRMAGIGAIETCSLFSPMDRFDDAAVARLVADHAISGAFTSPGPEVHEPGQVTRRDLLRGDTSPVPPSNMVRSRESGGAGTDVAR